MIARLAKKVTSRALLIGIPALFALSCSTGCESEGYPAELTYPARSDALVRDRADRDAQGFDRPGDYPKVLFPDLPDEDRQKLLVDPEKMDAARRDELEKLLNQLFGTPAEPKVTGLGAAAEVVQKLAAPEVLRLDPTTLELGSKIYRQQCLHCHGLSGDGRGPTSPWVNPHPRDYRQGVFKFTSSKQAEGERKPRRDDIARTIREGIEGSSMPSFRLLPEEHIDALTSYVIHLSLRGEIEFYVMRAALLDQLDTSLPAAEQVHTAVEEGLTAFAGRWLDAQKKENLISPDMVPASKSDEEMKQSVQRGWKLFTQQGDAGCISCHMDYGRQAAYKYDVWGTVVRPADLTTGVYRGGRRPIDLFWRIHSGINGTGMTAFGGSLKSEQIWDVVNFLQILPYPAMREKYDIRLESK